jgi:IS1 family transposase
MRIPFDRAVLVLSLLTEGMSIRGTERVTGHHRDTIMRLLVLAGGRCERLLDEMVRDVPVEDVEADELWSFIGMKQKTKDRKGLDSPELGDCYTFLGLERSSKLILTHYTGQRTWNSTEIFVSKLAKATAGPFQLTTDGWDGYGYAVPQYLRGRADYAQLIKEYGTESEAERRYSPPRIIGTEKRYILRHPDPDRVCTSYAERLNLDVRMKCRRFTRLTNAFSRKLANHRAAVAVMVAAHNLCWMHRTIRMTPAMKAGLVNRPWSIGELLAA